MNNFLVIGETCVDEYVFGKCDRICPEAPAICFIRCPDSPIKTNLGMAGNVLENIKSILFKNSIKGNVDIATNTCSSHTITKRRFIDKRYNSIVFREDINDSCHRIDLNHLTLDDYQYIVISDYNKGFISEQNYADIRKLSPANSVVFADTKKIVTINMAKSIDVLKINRQEANKILNINDLSFLCDIIVTDGGNGAILIQKGQTQTIPTQPIDVIDVCGAGDTFLAALVIDFSQTRNLQSAIRFANIYAGQVVSKQGVCVA